MQTAKTRLTREDYDKLRGPLNQLVEEEYARYLMRTARPRDALKTLREWESQDFPTEPPDIPADAPRPDFIADHGKLREAIVALQVARSMHPQTLAIQRAISALNYLYEGNY